jgi:hypothetical protein
MHKCFVLWENKSENKNKNDNKKNEKNIFFCIEMTVSVDSGFAISQYWVGTFYDFENKHGGVHIANIRSDLAH